MEITCKFHEQNRLNSVYGLTEKFGRFPFYEIFEILVVDTFHWEKILDPKSEKIFNIQEQFSENSINTYWSGPIHGIACLLFVMKKYFSLDREKLY